MLAVVFDVMVLCSVVSTRGGGRILTDGRPDEMCVRTETMLLWRGVVHDRVARDSATVIAVQLRTYHYYH